MTIQPRRNMNLDYDELKETLDGGVDDADRAENYGFFIEQYLDLDSHEGFLKTVEALPRSLRTAYLPFHADIQISSGGLPRLLKAFDNEAIRKEVAESYSSIGESALAAIISECWSYDRIAEEVSIPDINDHTDGIQRRYFTSNSALMESIGRYLRVNKDLLLSEAGRGNDV